MVYENFNWRCHDPCDLPEEELEKAWEEYEKKHPNSTKDVSFKAEYLTFTKAQREKAKSLIEEKDYEEAFIKLEEGINDLKEGLKDEENNEIKN